MSDKRIYKYPISVTDEFELCLPKGADILTIQTTPTSQGEGVPYIWAMVDTEAPNETRRFRIIGTGNPIPEFDLESAMRFEKGYKYIGTFQQAQGMLIWHLLEV